MTDRVALRDRLTRRFYDRPGTVAAIAAAEFPEADAADVAAVERHVGVQCSEFTIGRAMTIGGEHADPSRRRRWEPGDL